MSTMGFPDPVTSSAALFARTHSISLTSRPWCLAENVFTHFTVLSPAEREEMRVGQTKVGLSGGCSGYTSYNLRQDRNPQEVG